MDKKYRDFLIAKRTVLLDINNRLVCGREELRGCESKAAILDTSKDVVNGVLIATLQEIKIFVEEAVTLCLAIVFGDEYKFELDYQVKRGRSEASMWLMRGSNKLDPKAEIGGGIIDIMSFALRLIMWVMSQPRTAPVFICDEPFRFVSRDHTSSLVDMRKEVCKTFGAQFIIVTHNDELTEGSGKYVRVSYTKGLSSVKEES